MVFVASICRGPCLTQSANCAHSRQVCWDGGELVCCDVCPAAYHAECLGQDPSHLEAKQHWACPHHACAACGRGPVAAGGMLFRCAHILVHMKEPGGPSSTAALVLKQHLQWPAAGKHPRLAVLLPVGDTAVAGYFVVRCASVRHCWCLCAADGFMPQAAPQASYTRLPCMHGSPPSHFSHPLSYNCYVTGVVCVSQPGVRTTCRPDMRSWETGPCFR